MITDNSFKILTSEEKSQYVFGQCEQCGFYPCELIQTYTLFKQHNPGFSSFSYNPEEMVNGCSMKQRWVQRECYSDYVSVGIGDHFKVNTILDHKTGGYRIERTKDNLIGDRTVDRWEPNQPVFISAPTGSIPCQLKLYN